MPGGRLRPAVKPAIFACVVASAFATASFIAAITRSSSMSLSSPSEARIDAHASSRRACRSSRPSRAPRPTGPRPRSSRAPPGPCFMFSCICCACFISAPIPPFIMAITSCRSIASARVVRRAEWRKGRPRRPGRARGRARTGPPRSPRAASRLLSRHLARLRGGHARCPPWRPRAPIRRKPAPKCGRELGLQLVLVGLLRIHAMRLRHDELEVVVLERAPAPPWRASHSRHAGELQPLDEPGPIAVERAAGRRPRAAGRFTGGAAGRDARARRRRRPGSGARRVRAASLRRP